MSLFEGTQFHDANGAPIVNTQRFPNFKVFCRKIVYIICSNLFICFYLFIYLLIYLFIYLFIYCICSERNTGAQKYYQGPCPTFV